MADTKTLRTEVQTLSTQAKAFYAELEQKGAENVTAEDRTRLENMIAVGEAKRKALDDALRLEHLDEVNQPGDGPRVGADLVLPGRERKSIGERFVESPQFKNREMPLPGQSGLRVQPMEIGSVRALIDQQQKDIYTTTTSQTVGTLAPPQYEPEIIDIARQRPPSVIDLVPMRRTSAPAVFYVLYSARTNNAAPTAEYASGNFGLKAKSDMAFDLKEAFVRTIPTYVQASRQILDDAPALAAEINNDLSYMVRLVLEDQMISGDGTGQNFTGILATSGIQTRVMSASAPSGRGQTTADTKADTLRRAITDLQLAFYDPSGMVLNPADAEALELTKDSQGRYIMIFDPVTNRLWRVPVAVTAAMTALTAIVGNFQLGCKLWDRMQTTIRIGEPNDLFLRNAVAILAELRAAFAVTRPLAFEKVTLI